MIRHILLSLTLTSASLLMSCGKDAKNNPTPSLFNTKAEAEAAANDFKCTGAHKMGDKWMPCAKHGNHE